MAAQTCTRCGAPLPGAEPETTVTCTYCGTSIRIRSSPGGGAAVGLIAAVGVLVMLGGVGASVMFLGGGDETEPPAPVSVAAPSPAKPPPPPRPPPPPEQPESKALSLSELAQHDTMSWKEIDISDMPGDLKRLDVADTLPWLIAAAQNWSSDIRLQRVFVKGLAKDGSIDLSSRDDFDIDLRFFSPKRKQAAKDMLSVSENKLHAAFRLRLHQGKLEAQTSELSSSHKNPTQDVELGCSMADVMKASLDKGLEARPNYDGDLHEDQGRWRWEIRGKEIYTGPRIDPKTCESLY